MAKKTDPDDLTLYDLDPKFQARLLKWLVDNMATIVVTVENGKFHIEKSSENQCDADDLESGLNFVIKSKARRGAVSGEFQSRVKEFLSEHEAALVINAAPFEGEIGFRVTVASDHGEGTDVDIDFEIALVLAEDNFFASVPKHRLPPDDRAALEQALVPPAQREEENDERQERLRRAFMEPRAELLENRQTVSYQRWCHEVDEQLAAVGARRQDSEYWRRLYQAGFTPAEAMVEFGAGVTDRAQWLRSEDPSPRPRRTMPTDPVELAYLENPEVIESHSRRTPPPLRRSMASRAAQERGLPRVQRMSREYDERPFDPEAEREHYASAHHFAVNTRR